MTKKVKLLFGCLAVPVGALLILMALIIFYPHWRSKETQSRAMMTGFIMGLKAYYTEYHQFPADAFGPDGFHAPLPTRGKILTALHPDQTAPATANNLRRINFYDPPAAKEKKTGLYYDEKKEPILVDPWGTPLYFLVSPDEKGEVSNPDPRDNKQNPKIKASAVIFSAGPDRNPDTWEDNILSWK